MKYITYLIIFQKNNDTDVPDFIHKYYFKEGYRKFQNFYKKWLLEVTVEEELHPWDQFKNKEKQINEYNSKV